MNTKETTSGTTMETERRNLQMMAKQTETTELEKEFIIQSPE